MNNRDGNQNDVMESIIRGLNEAIDFESGVGSARVNYMQIRQDMKELDDLAEQAGGYVIPPGSDEVRYDFRKIIAYCKEHSIEPIDLTIRELGQFVIKKSE
ncbi:MAG: hypothetical protein IJH07_10535 [Ruminococcus sp.]|nr:hypothetical protein [Ruminococcus sp.]